MKIRAFVPLTLSGPFGGLVSTVIQGGVVAIAMLFIAISAEGQQHHVGPVDLFVRGSAAPTQYLQEIVAHLAKHQSYPLAARKLGQEGEVVMLISIDKTGTIKNYRVKRGSGKEVLDNAALELISSANPFPAFPVYMEGEELEFSIPIRYLLKK